MVVSEIGEQWISEQAAERTAPTAMANGMENALGHRYGKRHHNCEGSPGAACGEGHKCPNRKIAAGTSAAEKLMDFSTSTMNCAVPSS